MKLEASKKLKWLYCLTLITSILPTIFGASGWMGLATGNVLGPALVFLLFWIAIYLVRIWLVVRHSTTLDSFAPTIFTRGLRKLGIALMTLGCIGSIAIVFNKQLALAFFGKPGDAGVAFFAMGMYLYFLASAGLPGVLIFELSRLLGFEANLRDVP
jgi:hypothetical protein